MRKAVNKPVLIFLVTSSLAILAGNCTKSEGEQESECKVCKAYGSSGIDAQETVCSPAAETAFRNSHAGKEISCN